MADKSTIKSNCNSSSILIVHSKDLTGDLSKVISLSSKPEYITEIKIVLPSLKFMNALIELNNDDEGVNIVTDAWSIGISITIIIHQKLIPLLSPDKLYKLPILLKDHKGFDIIVINKKVISYSDVALFKNAWILVGANVITTNLAFEHMQKNDLYIVKQ